MWLFLPHSCYLYNIAYYSIAELSNISMESRQTHESVTGLKSQILYRILLYRGSLKGYLKWILFYCWSATINRITDKVILR